jgi:CHAT domain-containing protein
LNEILTEEVGQDLLQEDANDMQFQKISNLVQEDANDMQFQKISDLVQEDEDDMQIQKIPTPLEGVDNQTVESCDDISPNMTNNNEDLDWFFRCESMDLQLIPEKVEIKQDIKNKDLGEQHLVKKISNFERLS